MYPQFCPINRVCFSYRASLPKPHHFDKQRPNESDSNYHARKNYIEFWRDKVRDGETGVTKAHLQGARLQFQQPREFTDYSRTGGGY